MNERPLRVLHCPWNLAGQQAALAAAERRLGVDSRNVVLFETAPGFKADEVLATHNQLARVELARYRLLWRAIRWADVVHYAFGTSILTPNIYPDVDGVTVRRPLLSLRRLYARAVWFGDLPLLKALGKTLVVTWQGDDARQGDRSRALFDISIAHELTHGYYSASSDRWKRRIIGQFARLADRQYAVNPDLLHVLPPEARFLPYGSFDVWAVEPVYPSGGGERRLRIVHAPSHRGAKGTRYVLDAIDVLRREGRAFEFELIEGLPRNRALERLARADIVVDQLLAGWYGGLSLEAMSLGKVVVCYVRTSDLKFVPRDFAAALPVINATPSDVVDVLRTIISTPRAELNAIGRSGRAFAERFHAPEVVAQTTVNDYKALSKD